MAVSYPSELRERLLRHAKRAGFRWTGSLPYLDFFSQILDLEKLPSSDSRFEDAHSDMWQHTVNNDDWDEQNILADARFDPMRMNDETFGTFLRMALSIDGHTEEELESFGQKIKPIVSAFSKTLVRRMEYGIFEGLDIREGRAEVTNQGRGHSRNPAALEHAGLLFRSQPEIQLFDALVEAGFLLAPLPVFIQKATSGQYRRCEVDFIVVRYGIWAVIEVDGENWHHETPQQAHARLQGFEDQGARVIRVPANVASGPDGEAHRRVYH